MEHFKSYIPSQATGQEKDFALVLIGKDSAAENSYKYSYCVWFLWRGVIVCIPVL